jgi:tetratricopeptide (TPR) repeat protein
MDNPLEMLIERARRAFDRRDYRAALTDAREVLAQNPSYADLRNLSGLCLSFLGDPQGALVEFDRALALNDRYIEAHLNRAITLNELGRFDEARQAFEAATFLEHDTESPFPAMVSARLANAHATVGDLYMEAAAPNEAIEQYEKALGMRPRFHDIRNKLGQALMQLGDLDGAERELRRVLEGNARFISARLNLGLVLFRRDRVDEAAMEWERCRAQQPGNPQVRAYMAMLEQHAESKRARERASP